jgi:DNA-binding CsgD family transcriptional regulator
MSQPRDSDSELLSLFYSSLSDPDRRSEFLSELCRQTQCDKASVSFHNLGNSQPTIGYSAGLSPRAQQDYVDHYAKINPAAPSRFRSVAREGWSQTINLIDERPDYRDSEYAQDYLLPNGLYYSAIGIGSSDGQNFASLAFIRSKSDGRLGSRSGEIIRFLAPHLKYAFPLFKQFDALRADLKSVQFALDRFDTAVIAVDGGGCVLMLNNAAEAVLKKGDGLMLSRGRLAAVLPNESTRLELAVSSAALTGSGRGAGIGEAILVHRRQSSTPLSVFVAPFHSNSIFASERPCALIFVGDAAARPLKRSGLMRALFNLTPAENRLVGLLLEGLDVRAASDQLHITQETARFMLKRIFEKTSTHRQSQLIRLISMLPGE